jgi:hypothetical protein
MGVKRVVVNHCTNALKATPGPGIRKAYAGCRMGLRPMRPCLEGDAASQGIRKGISTLWLFLPTRSCITSRTR